MAFISLKHRIYFAMIISLVSISILLSSALDPAFLSGDVGLYTTTAAFRKSGEVYLNIRESLGTLNDHDNNESSLHNQVCMNLQYAPLSRMVMGIGGTSYTLKDETFNGLYANIKFPLLTIGRLTSSVTPHILFSTAEKPVFGASVSIDLVPFATEQLPPLLFSHTFAMLRRDEFNEYQFSSLLTFHKGRFLPFLEFYTEYHDRINRKSTYNTRLCTGLGFLSKPLSVRAAVEIPLDEYTRRDFDFRFTGEFGILFNAKRRSKITLTIIVYDAVSDEKIDATIMVKGKEVEKILSCTAGSCTISGLVAGLYTIEIEHTGYKKMKAPLFIKDKSMERTFRLTKLSEEKGGE